jgi:acetate kinase
LGLGLNVLVVNAGSTSLKLDLVAEDDTSNRVESFGAVEDVDAVAHRVVHGGPQFRDPVVIDATVRERISELEEIAPLHNAPALAALEDAERAFPGVPHVAVFDTAFHATIPPEAATYALPARWREEWGIRRYGFHGLSVQWAAEQVTVPRLVVCHLGGGCSVTAVRDGCSVDTTMGFSPLEGVPMTTRSGSVDPGALIYLLRGHVSIDELDSALNGESGLKGLGGGSGDMREIEVAGGLAFGVFTYRVAAAIGAMAAALDGIDAIVFTAGIGENSAPVRAGVCTRLSYLGVDLDLDRNADAEPDCVVSAVGARVRVHVIRAREELVAARAVRTLIR